MSNTHRFSIRHLMIAAATLSGLTLGSAQAQQTGTVGPNVPEFWVRPGYRVTLAAEGIREARFLEIGNEGTLYVSQPGAGSIISMRDTNGDGVYDQTETFVSGKPTIHGMQFVDGWLWFTQSGAVYKAQDANKDGKADEVITVIADDGTLPKGGGHWWRSICVVGDGFYTSIGDDGNINDHTNDDRGKIWKFSLDGKNKTLFSSGLRNTEKLLIRPGTNNLFGADHGSDDYGRNFGEGRGAGDKPVTDQNPPCEFNLYKEGQFYGHPFIVGNKLPRLEFRDRKDITALAAKTVSPAWCFGAHWAPNGWTFVTKHGGVVPKGDAVVALHGSWNSSVKVGYRVEHLCFDSATGEIFGAQPLVKTLGSDGQRVLGRPCDVVEAPDGSILFSDDSTRRVYRISVVK